MVSALSLMVVLNEAESSVPFLNEEDRGGHE